MNKKTISTLIIFSSGLALAVNPRPEGFFYGGMEAPGGWEWQSPDSLAYNKEQPRATFYTFPDRESARRVLPENSRYWMSLDGDWKFKWVKEPSLRQTDFYRADFDDTSWDDIKVPSNWNIAGLQKDGSQRYGTPIYVNQKVIFSHKVEEGDWKGGVMRTPPETWTTFDARNEVGSYRRIFEIPSEWKGREVYINFDGVDSFFYLWINGHYVGFSKNSRNAARFNITGYLKKGENMVAVEVYRNSDGSFLEAQDMFRLPGIFRSVSLTSVSPIEVRDLVVIPELTDDYRDGQVRITADLRNLTKKDAHGLRMKYSLYECGLYSDSNKRVDGIGGISTPVDIGKGKEASVVTEINIENPRKWSAETPWRYVLVGELTDKKGKVIETVSTYFGFRKVELLETPAEKDEFGKAGRYFHVNGQPVKLKGVNRHETMPEAGHALTKERMQKDVMLMKRANINHVRNSHYPDAPYWYYLADKYGLYLEDEANLESHEYYYGKASLSHVAEWEAAHVARNMEMVHSRVNSPSVVIWSLGNEAGPGKNFISAYEAIKRFDTSRPIQYERNNSIVDIGSNQYPSIQWVQEAVKGDMDIKYPFHISEYAHSMGNAAGGLEDYWKAIESTNHFMGGAIWDWVDQSLYNHTPEGTKYLGFGGDFGDFPNDGQFVMNGIMFGDLTPKPQYHEVKKVYQNVQVTPVDMKTGLVEIFNKNYFTSLGDYRAKWSLVKNGRKMDEGEIDEFNTAPPGPRERKIYRIPYKIAETDENAEYYLDIDFILKEDKPWATAGYVQMAEQLPITTGKSAYEGINDRGHDTPEIEEGEGYVDISGDKFRVRFGLASGTIETLEYDGEAVMLPGQGPKPDAFRAYLNNDNWISGQWFANGLYNLKHKVKDHKIFSDSNGRINLSFAIESQAPRGGRMTGGNGNSCGIYTIDESKSEEMGEDDFKFITNQIWTIYRDGSIELNSIIASNNTGLVLPRLGYVMEIPEKQDEYIYYGRGPEENYSDRKSGQFMGIYGGKVKDNYTDYTRPQSNSNREDVRWVALEKKNDDKNGKGLIFIAPEAMSMTATPYTEMEIFMSDHSYKLPKSDRTVLHLDAGVTGLGGASCGQGGPLEHQRITTGSPHRFSFIIRPLSEAIDPDSVMVRGSGLKPIGMSRDRMGKLTIDIPCEDAQVIYSIEKEGKQKIYTEPIDFKEGGKITAWMKDNPEVRASAEFSRIENIPLVAIYTSSEEPDDGEGFYLTDGDPSTIWHTMYSVTVATFPHWVDFDAGEKKMIKGVRYLPRQDGNNTGNIREYEIYVSQDGRNWGEPVEKGTFANDMNMKSVNFKSPVEGRFIRFMTLSAQDGREYATGAEFEVLAD